MSPCKILNYSFCQIQPTLVNMCTCEYTVLGIFHLITEAYLGPFQGSKTEVLETTLTMDG